MTILEALRAKLAQIAGNMEALTASAAAESRGLTPEEIEKFNAFDGQYRAAEQEVTAQERMDQIKDKQAALQPRRVQPEDPPAAPERPATTGGTPVAHGYRNHGFKKGLGEFLLAIRNATVFGHTDPRLMVNTISTYAGEQVGGDGGYLVPPDFAEGIIQAVQGADSFLSALRPVTTSSNMLTVNTDQVAPWASSTGITAAKVAEAAAPTASKPVFKPVQVILHKAASIVHVSDEQLEDVPFLTSYVMARMAEKIRYQVEDWILNGDGAGAPLGITQGPGLVTTAKESSQTRATTPLDPNNIFKMFGTLLNGGQSRAIWIINPTLMPSLWALTTGTGGFPLYAPDLKSAPGGMLMGRPIYLSECAALAGTANDVVLQDPAGYIYATKAGGLQTATTIAFAFDQGLQSFRASMRVGGAPVLQAKIARKASASAYAGHSINLGV